MPQENFHKKYKIVVDTNIFISSFFGGNPKKLFEIYFTDIYPMEIFISEAILAEIENVLDRISISNKYVIADFLNKFRDTASIVVVPPDMNLTVDIADTEDIKFIECAVTAGCSFII
jgi:putative toxin-antitoxin system toxin component, PIN family